MKRAVAVARELVNRWEAKAAEPDAIYPYGEDPRAQLLARALLEATDECDESSPRGGDGVRVSGPIEARISGTITAPVFPVTEDDAGEFRPQPQRAYTLDPDY